MNEYVIKYTKGINGDPKEMRVYAETNEEAVNKLPKEFRLLAAYPTDW